MFSQILCSAKAPRSASKKTNKQTKQNKRSSFDVTSNNEITSHPSSLLDTQMYFQSPLNGRSILFVAGMNLISKERLNVANNNEEIFNSQVLAFS